MVEMPRPKDFERLDESDLPAMEFVLPMALAKERPTEADYNARFRDFVDNTCAGKGREAHRHVAHTIEVLRIKHRGHFLWEAPLAYTQAAAPFGVVIAPAIKALFLKIFRGKPLLGESGTFGGEINKTLTSEQPLIVFKDQARIVGHLNEMAQFHHYLAREYTGRNPESVTEATA